jgi:hypothetical protein
MKGAGLDISKVYINTRVIKHIYDKRPAEEFDYCVENAVATVKYPDKIYKNKGGKRGSYCFVKEVKNCKCLVSVESVETPDDGQPPHFVVVTFFRVDDAYLKDYELLWEWKDGNPSS